MFATDPFSQTKFRSDLKFRESKSNKIHIQGTRNKALDQKHANMTLEDFRYSKKFSIYHLLHRYRTSEFLFSSVADLKTGGHLFDPRLGQYSFRRLMIVIATGFIPHSTLSVVSTMNMWESSQWLGKNILRSTV